MILIAPDKYRGTLTAREAALIMKEALPGQTMMLPMADGGEGTAECIAGLEPGWRRIREGVYIRRETRELVVDSSAIIGYTPKMLAIPPLQRTSESLAVGIEYLYKKENLRKIYIGIGGTAVCDGGLGFVNTLDSSVTWNEILVGLADVKASLLPDGDTSLSALDFCLQKGYSGEEIGVLRKRLTNLEETHGKAESEFTGAGGGLGYGLTRMLGAPCYSGAKWILERARIPWDKINLVITGEGKYDSQTGGGKTVWTLAEEAQRQGVTCVCMAGCVEEGSLVPEFMQVVDCSRYFPEERLTPQIAARRLRKAMAEINTTGCRWR